MRRITLSGEQLQEHERDGISVPSLLSHGFDDDVRLIFPDPETGERPHPIAQNDGKLCGQKPLRIYSAHTRFATLTL